VSGISSQLLDAVFSTIDSGAALVSNDLGVTINLVERLLAV
jgi:hypothetical protein